MNSPFHNPWAGLTIAIFLLIGFAHQSNGESTQKGGLSVTGGREISIEYTLKLEDQTVVDTNAGTDQPLIYIHGSKQIIPGLEKSMEGMKIGETRKITVVPEEGYGSVDQDAFLEVEKEKLPENAMEVGTQIEVKDQSGHTFAAQVSEIMDETVMLDFNHPLAGKTLLFEVKVLAIHESQHP
jgi:FKBP-type peptidyl-prolyl cis-trans isomerase SlyD